MIDENDFAKELGKVMEEGDKASENRMRLRPVPSPSPLTPTGVSKVVASATDEDTQRAGRTMLEQMDNIIANLERDIAEEDKVRLTIVERIDNLNLARQACFAAKEVLKGRLK
jgi:hypothetical protein